MTLLVQGAAGGTSRVVGMIIGASPSTQIVLGVLAFSSFLSWIIILWKWRQFRRLQRDGQRFVQSLERAQRLEDAYKVIMRLSETPYTRVFRQGTNFFSELRPGALREDANPAAGLSETQLSALWLVLEKVQDEERDGLSGGIVWLAIIAVTAPLLGLLGTVIGVMIAFIGITTTGTANIGSVAPGIAEALITTAFGLVAAIPAAIGYNYFVHRLDRFSGELEGFASEFIGTLAREGRL
ncbi:MAG TPA: MotA/TolQ/ExbB proton channel family protein [Solirubrobacteraceae bacterium]|nr:MotA/TolQ/ExbB proton channel family protein [Solirubrobacteraceae bacterium]